jgi:hypothetical protein
MTKKVGGRDMLDIKILQIIQALEALHWKAIGNWYGYSEAYHDGHDIKFTIQPMAAGAEDRNWHGDMWKEAMLKAMIELCEEQDYFYFKKVQPDYEFCEVEYGIDDLIKDLKEVINDK